MTPNIDNEFGDVELTPRPPARDHSFGGSGASAEKSLRSGAEALIDTLVSDGKRLEIRYFYFVACGSSIPEYEKR
jgi:hypothetical protein